MSEPETEFARSAWVGGCTLILKVPTLTRPDFDIASLRVAEIDLIFRLGGSNDYRKAVLDDSIREFLAGVLQSQYAQYDLSTQQDWQEWDYSNEPATENNLLFPWRAEGLQQMEFLLDYGIMQRLGDMSEALLADSYYVDFIDGNGKHLIAAREMRTLKSVQKKKMGFFSENKLTILNQEVIQIASNFNFVFDDTNVFIFNPKTFELLSELDKFVAVANASNIVEFTDKCSVIKWPNIVDTSNRYKRFAKHLRSIIARGEYDKFDIDKIKIGLSRKGIPYVENADGTIAPAPNHEFDFLKFLDHTIFDIEITADPATPYEATNRRRKT